MGAFALQCPHQQKPQREYSKKIEEFGFEKNDTRGLAKQG